MEDELIGLEDLDFLLTSVGDELQSGVGLDASQIDDTGGLWQNHAHLPSVTDWRCLHGHDAECSCTQPPDVDAERHWELMGDAVRPSYRCRTSASSLEPLAGN